MVWSRRMAQGSHRAAQNVNRARRDRAATNMYMLGMPARRKSREGLGLAGGLPLAVAVRRTSAGGYDVAAFGADLFAGTVVGIVALPLSMALAIAVGVPPQHGLYTAIVAGTVAALTGGSKFQVTGPTAAFVVVLAPIVSRFGLSGLLTAGLMAGPPLGAVGPPPHRRRGGFIPRPGPPRSPR